jgi:hypothetical protein
MSKLRFASYGEAVNAQHIKSLECYSPFTDADEFFMCAGLSNYDP